jgi:hypothetical protein
MEEKGSKSDQIKNRESWLKVIAIALFAVLFAWKFLTSPINLVDFRLSDLLVLILSIFAIWLAVMFYFKATETSNTFYNNTYEFTKDISEILGRIEAGFGERLKHLDEGYAALRDKYDRSPVDTVNASKQVEEEGKKVKKKEEEMEQLIQDLVKKTQLQDKEKDELIKKWREKDKELVNAKSELQFLQERLAVLEKLKSYQAAPLSLELPRNLVLYIKRRLLKEFGLESVLEAPRQVLLHRFESVKSSFAPSFLEALREFDIVDDHEVLTNKGIQILKEIAANIR